MRDPTKPTDLQLVERMRAGDEAASRTLVQRHGRRIYGFALRLTLTAGDAEEVFLETFLTAARARPDLANDSRFITCLYRTAARAALGTLEARERGLESEDGQPEEGAPTNGLARFDAAPHTAEPGPELRASMEEGISHLPAALRAVVLLRDVEGLGTAEVAMILDLPAPAVHARLHRARLALRAEIAAHVGGPATPVPQPRPA